jgi:hypothetical protein
VAAQWLLCFSASTVGQSTDSFSVKVTRSGGFWSPSRFHAFSVDQAKVVTLDFFLDTKQSLKDAAADSDLLAIKVLLDRANFFQLRDNYARREDGCDSIAQDAGSTKIDVSYGIVSKSVRYNEGCYSRNNVDLQALRQLIYGVELILDRPEWRRLRNQEMEELIKKPPRTRGER